MRLCNAIHTKCRLWKILYDKLVRLAVLVYVLQFKFS